MENQKLMEKQARQRSTVQSMTEGSPIRLILSFMLPLLLGNLFQQAYNVVDGMIVGRMLGADALAAVGASSSVQFLVLGLCIGSCSGFAIPISQRFGAGDERGLHVCVWHSVILSAILAAIMTTVTAILCPWILRLMQTPDTIYDNAYAYLFVIFCGLPFTILYNMTAGMLRAVGNSRAPFLFLAVATFLNIFLDMFCIAVLHWGCAGAAVATVASQALSGLFCLLYIIKKVPQLHPTRRDMRWDGHAARILVSCGLPMGLQYSITAIGSMTMQSANNSLGSVYVSGFTAGTKIKQLVMCPFDAISTSLATYVGQNYGARKMDRVKKGVTQTILCSLAYGVAAGVIMVSAGRTLSSLFLTADNASALDASAQYLRCMGYLFWVLAFLNVFRCTMQSLDAAGLAILSGVIEMAARVTVASVFVPIYGYNAICWTDQSAWVTATIYVSAMSFVIIRRLTQKLRRAE